MTKIMIMLRRAVQRSYENRIRNIPNVKEQVCVSGITEMSFVLKNKSDPSNTLFKITDKKTSDYFFH